VVLGMDSAGLGGGKFSRIGYVSENQEMADWTTVAGMLNYLRSFYPTWDRGLEERLVRQFDLPLKRKLKQLSRGMRMKAAFVSSLAYRPAVIVLDEPLSGLDPFVRDELIEALREQAREATILLSSHDLAEIESFATHVGFIEQGRMLFSEEMAVLVERFRMVTVTLSEPTAPRDQYPAGWLNVETADGLFRFVHRDFQGDPSSAEVRELLPDAGEIRFEAMPLRSIFLAIAKANRLRKRAADEGVAA
jgi:ABC-2 type transport system ATP-binding protein